MGNGTRDIPACTLVSPPTTLPSAPFRAVVPTAVKDEHPKSPNTYVLEK
jgi:hypothetical protein